MFFLDFLLGFGATKEITEAIQDTEALLLEEEENEETE